MGLSERDVNLMERTFLVTGVFLAVIFSILCLALLLWPAAGFAAETKSAAEAKPPAAKHEFAGTDKCKKCHKLQFETWEKTKHATAVNTVKKMPKDLKVDPEVAVVTDTGVQFVKTGEFKTCLSCHTTGYDEKTGKAVHEGVSCEACHGAGADYGKVAIMKNREKAVAAGLTIPTEATCRQCHRADNPFEKEKFNFDKRKGKVHEHKKKSEGAK
ncbi:cytochrome c family protein [bacterium]|nr:cytochrome c family protein [bacterium]